MVTSTTSGHRDRLGSYPVAFIAGVLGIVAYPLTTRFWVAAEDFHSWGDASEWLLVLGGWFAISGVLLAAVVPRRAWVRDGALAVAFVVACFVVASWNQLVIVGAEKCVEGGELPAEQCNSHEGAAGMVLMVMSLAPAAVVAVGGAAVILLRHWSWRRSDATSVTGRS